MKKPSAIILLILCLAFMVSCDDKQAEETQKMCAFSFVPYSGYITMLINGDFFLEGINEDYIDEDNILDTYSLNIERDSSNNIISMDLLCFLSNEDITVSISCHDIECFDHNVLYGFLEQFKGELDLRILDGEEKTIAEFSFNMKATMLPKTPMLPPRYSYKFEFHNAYAQGKHWKTELVTSYMNELANSIM